MTYLFTTYEGLITIEIRRLNTKLKFWLLFSLSVPTIIIIALSAIIINSASALSLQAELLIFSGILLLGFLGRFNNKINFFKEK